MADTQKGVVTKDEQTFDLTPVLTPISIFLSGLIIAASIFFGLRGANLGTSTSNTVADGTASSAPAAAGETVTVNTVDFGGGPMLGNLGSNIMMVEFTDFQCPYCERHFTETYPELKKNYVDTNLISYFSKDFPLSFHENAQKSAEAAQCALDQGKYWEMHDKLFSNQDKLAVTDLKAYAKELGLNETDFNTCLDTGKNAERVATSTAAGTSGGVNGTPGFLVGEKVSDTSIKGFLIPGAFPYSNFATVLEDIKTLGVDKAAENFQLVLNGAS